MMKQVIYAILFVVILMNPTFAWSQDTINLLNGKQIAAKSIYQDTNSTILKYDILKKTMQGVVVTLSISGNSIMLKYDILKKDKIRRKTLGLLDIFSIDFATNEHKILYSQDSALGFERSISQMEAYIYGEREAIKNYKAPWVTIGGVAAGFVPTTFYLNFYGLLAPVVYGVGIGIITPKVKTLDNVSSALKNDKNFLDGYKNVAIRKKLKNAILGAVAGVAVAGIVSTIINAN